jgi:hypothetical protein
VAAADPNDLIPSARFNPMPPSKRLDERLRRYFDRHPEVSRQEFLLKALWGEIHFREQREPGNAVGPGRRERAGTTRWSTARPPLTAEDIRIHAWLTERWAVLHHERHSLWPKLRRLLFGNRLVRWLGLPPRRTEDETKRWRAVFE